MEHDGEDPGWVDTEKVEQSEDVCVSILRRYRNSEAPEHRHLCAISLAISEIFKEQALSKVPTAYFAAAMSSLEKQSNTTPRDTAVTTALCTFLSMVMPKLPSAVLRSKGDETSKLLVRILNADASVPATVKVGLICVECVLKAGDKSNWIVMAPSFQLLLKNCIDLRPKVRKRAQTCIAAVLCAFQDSPASHMASDAIVSMFEKSLNSVVGRFSGANAETSKVAARKSAIEVLHLVGSLAVMLPQMSSKAVARILPILADLQGLRQPLLTKRILDTLHAFCTTPDSDIPGLVLGDVLAKVTGIFDSGERKDVDDVVAASRLMERGFQRLHSINAVACAAKLPVVFNALGGLLASEQEEIVFSASEAMKSLVWSCVDEVMVHEGVNRLTAPSSSWQKTLTGIERICATAESILGYQFSTAWDRALNVVSSLFEKLGPSSYILMAGIVKTLADLQALPDQDLNCRKQLHKTIGAALGAMGPDQLLSILPLEMDSSDLGSSRIWLLPILKQHMVGARIGFFAEHILPLATGLRERAQKSFANGKPVAAKNAEACVQSLWALLPSVCNYPIDTASKFSSIAKTLGDALKNEPELRGIICSALQTLVLQNKFARGDKLVGTQADKAVVASNGGEHSAAELRAKSLYTAEVVSANISSIAAYSRNFLPCLFNLFMSAPANKRGDLQATIGVLASISEKQTVKNFFFRIMKELLQATKEAVTTTKVQGSETMQVESLKQEEKPNTRRCVFMDLAISLIQGLDEEALNVLFSTSGPALQDSDGAVQKKAYKLLATICKGNVEFLETRSEQMLEMLLIGLACCHSSARRHRLTCVHYIILHFSKVEDNRKDETIATLISEIILATKETNKKTRNGAYDLLIAIGHGMEDLDQGSSDGHLMRYFSMILGCMAGTTPHMISAAVAALARLIYEFSPGLCHTIPDLLPSALILIQSKSREIIKSVLGLIKVIIARLPVVDFQQHLRSLVQGLMIWSDDSKNHFKSKVREIMERIVRKCGVEAVAAVIPQQHMKLLTSIRKKKEKNEKKKREVNGDGDGDDGKSLKSIATARRSAWNHTDFFSDDGEDEDSEDDYYTSTKANTIAKTNTVVKTASTTRYKKLRKLNKRLPEDSGNEPLDLLDTHHTREALSVLKTRKQLDDPEDAFEVGPDGRFIVDEKVDRAQEKPTQSTIDLQPGDVEKASRKRYCNDASRMPPSKGDVKENPKKKPKRSSWAYTGEEYSSQKGKSGGDQKKQGKLDPYAYWPLDPKILNRRRGKKAAARDAMSSVFKVKKTSTGPHSGKRGRDAKSTVKARKSQILHRPKKK